MFFKDEKMFFFIFISNFFEKFGEMTCAWELLSNKLHFCFDVKIVQRVLKTNSWLEGLKTEINDFKWVNEFVGFSNSSIRTRALILVNW